MIKSGPNLNIRPFEATDWPILSHWFYSGDYAEFFRDISMAMNVEQFQTYARMVNGYSFLIRLQNEFKGHPVGACVGFVMLYEMNWVASTAKLGILIDKEFQGQMLCMESIWLIADYVFNQLRLRKLIVDILETNKRLEGIVKFGGFKKEARLKKDAVVNGKAIDILRYCIFDREAKKRIQTFGEQYDSISSSASSSGRG